jgi:hypothetical protein
MSAIGDAASKVNQSRPLLQRQAVWLDIAAFFFNLAALFVLAPLYAWLAAQAGGGSTAAKALVAVFCFAMAGLAPAGAVIKRRAAHLRNPDLREIGKKITSSLGVLVLLYFGMQLMFLIIGVNLLDEALGSASPFPALWTWMWAVLPLAAALDTLLVCLFFFPPKASAVMADPAGSLPEWIGDAVIFLNMVCYQVLLWYLLSDAAFDGLPTGVADFLLRLVELAGFLLFFYLPPRLFYLAEEYHPRRSWASMLLASLPVVLRVVFGIG